MKPTKDLHYRVDFVMDRSTISTCAWGESGEEAINVAECILFEDHGIKPNAIRVILTPTTKCVECGL